MSRDEIERALRTLHLRPDATPQDVVEARDRLLAQWDPDRLPQYSGLREKAESRIAEIRKAFDLLITHTGGSGEEKPSLATAPQTNPPEAAGIPSRDEKPGTSLFDEVFSPRVTGRRYGVPVLLLAGAVLIVVLGLFYLLSTSPSDPGEAATVPPGLEIPPADPVPPSPGTGQHAAVADPDPAAVSGQTQEPPSSAKPVVAREQTAHRPAAPQRSVMPDQPSPAGVAEPTPPPAPRRQPEADVQPAPVPLPEPEAEKEDTPVAEQPPAEQEDVSATAFRSLLENSQTARQLTTGEVSGYRFLEWKLVQQKGPEIWIDLLASDAAGRTVHFIWSINLENSQIVALSQAARNLETIG